MTEDELIPDEVEQDYWTAVDEANQQREYDEWLERQERERSDYDSHDMEAGLPSRG